MHKILSACLLILSSGHASAELVASSNSSYICSVNGENPIDRGQYDQTIFIGDVLRQNGENAAISEVIIIKPDLQVIRAPDFQSLQIQPREWAILDKSVVMLLNLTPQSTPDLKRQLTISIGRVSVTGSAPLWNPISIGGGYHKGSVFLIDRTLNVAASCYHQSYLGE